LYHCIKRAPSPTEGSSEVKHGIVAAVVVFFTRSCVVSDLSTKIDLHNKEGIEKSKVDVP